MFRQMYRDMDFFEKKAWRAACGWLAFALLGVLSAIACIATGIIVIAYAVRLSHAP